MQKGTHKARKNSSHSWVLRESWSSRSRQRPLGEMQRRIQLWQGSAASQELFIPSEDLGWTGGGDRAHIHGALRTSSREAPAPILCLCPPQAFASLSHKNKQGDVATSSPPFLPWFFSFTVTLHVIAQAHLLKHRLIPATQPRFNSPSLLKKKVDVPPIFQSWTLICGIHWMVFDYP